MIMGSLISSQDKPKVGVLCTVLDRVVQAWTSLGETVHKTPLRHGDCHNLIRARKKGRNGRRYVFSPCVQFSKGQGFSSVWNLQGHLVRELSGRAAEDLCQPPNSLLMRDVHKVPVAKNIRQAVLASVFLPGHCFRCPEVPSPCHVRQRKKYHKND